MHHQLGPVDVILTHKNKCWDFFYKNINKTQVIQMLSKFLQHLLFESEIWMFWNQRSAERHIFRAGCRLSFMSFYLGFMCSSPDTSRVFTWLTAHSVHMCVRVYVWYLARESGQAREHRNMKCLAVACSRLPAHWLASNTGLLALIKTCTHPANGTFVAPAFFSSLSSIEWHGI